MVGRLLPASSLASFKDAVLRQQSPDLVSKNLAAELLADQVGIVFFWGGGTRSDLYILLCPSDRIILIFREHYYTFLDKSSSQLPLPILCT